VKGRGGVRSGVGAIGLGAISVLWPWPATGADRLDPAVVDATIAASNQETGALVEALEDRVQRMGLRMRVERRQDPPQDGSWPSDVVAGLWIDARAADRIDLRITSVRDGSSLRAYDRSLARGESTALIAEQVAQVVRAELESILATEPAEPARAIAEVPARPASARVPVEVTTLPSAHVASPGGFGLDAVAFVSERALSAQSSPVFGAGAAVGVSAGRIPWHPGLWVSGAYDSRVAARSAHVTFDVSTASFRLIPTIELLDLDAMKVELGVGGGLDLFDVAPLVVRASQAVFDPPTRTVDPVLAAQILLDVRLGAQVGLTFGVALDYDGSLHSTPVSNDQAGGPRDTFDPWRLRPAAELGLCVALSSGGVCGKAP
jgi:hypothetical protein